MKISACIITKNQEKIIENCLISIKGLVEEIIILDTGSTDKTIEICSRYGKVYQDTWEDDFGKSRNKSISYATGDWLLFLDSDEILPTNTQNKFIEFKEKLMISRDYDIYCFNNYNPDQSHFINTYFKATVFKNNVGIKFIKKIHEHPYHPTQELNMINCLDMEIHHFGKLSDEKAHRDISIILDDIKLDPNQEYYYYRHLGDSYYILKDYEKSLDYYLKSYNILISVEKRTKMQDLFLINAISRLLRIFVYIKKDYKKGIFFSEKLLELARDNLEGHYYLAFCNNRIGNYEKSIKIYNKILKKIKDDKDNPFIANTYIDLSRAYNNSGEKLKSYELLIKANKISINNDFIKLLISKYFLLKNDYKSAIDIYYKSENLISGKFNLISNMLDNLLSYDLDKSEIQEINIIINNLKKSLI